MAMLPFQPTPFFANKNRAFWNLQIVGWTGAFLLRAISGLVGGQQDVPPFLLIITMEAVTGFSISLILSIIFRRLIVQRPLVTWATTAVVLVVAVGLFTFIETWLISILRASYDGNFAALFISFLVWPLTLLGGWSALYYAINFFLQVEEQADRLVRLETQATSAQLAMLRYQLNPHFLFNTLNSISTLVLLKHTEPANAMLTRLSSFLRHTLETEPGGKVTLAQEVETLKLYLDIERMRFEERLRTEFTIDPGAEKACLPSMLLQPLVENAVKYAVSTQEEGARISLSAQLVGQRLRVAISDTGPGLGAKNEQQALPIGASPASIVNGGKQKSTGVGLANIRDRLAQGYGEDHLFEIRNPADGGFTVIIEIPFEQMDRGADIPAAPQLPSNSGQAALQAGAGVPLEPAIQSPTGPAITRPTSPATTPQTTAATNPPTNPESGDGKPPPLFPGMVRPMEAKT